MSKDAPGVRYAEVERETSETQVRVVLDLDGGSRQDISTGIGFLDHMLTLMAFHGQFDLGLEAHGDLQIDDHHTVEDVGIVLGQAIRQALEGGGSIVRYASNHTPMDDALALVALDISGRGHLFFDVKFSGERLGSMATENIKEFFRALTSHAHLTLHVQVMTGENDHHIAEAIFKGFGRALHAAIGPLERRSHGTSTKGKID